MGASKGRSGRRFAHADPAGETNDFHNNWLTESKLLASDGRLLTQYPMSRLLRQSSRRQVNSDEATQVVINSGLDTKPTAKTAHSLE